MPTPTDDRRDLLTVIALEAAQLDAHLATPHLARFAGMIGDVLDENGLTITTLQRIA